MSSKLRTDVTHIRDMIHSCISTVYMKVYKSPLGVLQRELNTARLSLQDLDRQSLKPQSEITGITTVVINLLC